MRWHLSWFNFMLLFSNHAIVSTLSYSSLLTKGFKTLSPALMTKRKTQINKFSE